MAKKKHGKGRKVLFAVEIIILILFIGCLVAYGQINSKLNKIQTQELDLNKVQMNNVDSSLSGYLNIALFAIDFRGEGSDYSAENSDTIIVASINNDTKQVKLTSVYRDTLLDVGEGSYQKANAAYAYGGPEQALSMLNTNLDLQLTEYATVDFNALATTIDLLGGLDVPLSYAEIVFMNDYCIETSEVTGKDYTPIELPAEKPEDEDADLGTYHLNGVQATSYCRIRYTAGLDFKRSERQREIIQMMVAKAKKSSLSTLFSIMDQVFPMIQTSLDKQEIVSMIPNMLSYEIGETAGFPFDHYEMQVSQKGDVVVPVTLESNVQQLHEFLFDDSSYTPSVEVQDKSSQITSITGLGIESVWQIPGYADKVAQQQEQTQQTETTGTQ